MKHTNRTILSSIIIGFWFKGTEAGALSLCESSEPLACDEINLLNYNFEFPTYLTLLLAQKVRELIKIIFNAKFYKKKTEAWLFKVRNLTSDDITCEHRMCFFYLSDKWANNIFLKVQMA